MSHENKSEHQPAINEEAPLDGGTVLPLSDPVGPAQQKERTARELAIGFIFLFAIVIVLHYVAMIGLVAYGFEEGKIEFLNKTFFAMLPVISSLVSAAATYYFTRNPK